MSIERVPDWETDPALDYWPRVEAAIRCAAANRFELEYLAPQCHRKNCKQCNIANSSDLDKLFAMMKKVIADAVEMELRTAIYSDPEGYYEHEATQ